MASNPKEEKVVTRDKSSLISEACKAYGIDEKYILASRVDGKTGTVVIVTQGGAKVMFTRGDEVEPLDPVRVDGVIRKKMKPVTGTGKKNK